MTYESLSKAKIDRLHFFINFFILILEHMINL